MILLSQDRRIHGYDRTDMVFLVTAIVVVAFALYLMFGAW